MANTYMDYLDEYPYGLSPDDVLEEARSGGTIELYAEEDFSDGSISDDSLYLY